ncbi:MAG: hypothetical protein O9331_10750 [Acidovorax sp.]|nr:hypothetical protein [Acidovorax sp.]
MPTHSHEPLQSPSSTVAPSVLADLPPWAAEVIERMRMEGTPTAPTEFAQPLALLNLGAHTTQVCLCSPAEARPAHLLVLPLGIEATAQRFFHAAIPSPLDLETAIAHVEDEVYLAHQQYQPWAEAVQAVCGPVAWWSADEALAELAGLAGVPAAVDQVLALDAMERLFQRLSYVAQGRPAVSEGLPERASFFAALLLLRELMHHMPFHTLHVAGQPMPSR